MILATSRRQVNEIANLSRRVALREQRTAMYATTTEVPNSLCAQAIRLFEDTKAGNGRVRMNLQQSGPFIGMAGMATTFFLYAWSAIVVRDVVSLVVLPLFWLLLLVLSTRWFTTHPYRVLALPLVAAVAWFAAMLT